MKKRYKIIRKPLPTRNWGQSTKQIVSYAKNVGETATTGLKTIKTSYPRVGVYGIRKSIGLPKANKP